jgi:phosphatidylethanolamine/phosphatidyl-N-methylethanolamine N-methyltransferase
VSDSAQHVLSEITRRGTERPGFVISGIPLGTLGRERALALIDTVNRTLEEGGMYIQFQHSLLGRKPIRGRFRNLRTVPVLLNFPPAVIYYAQK